MPREPSGAAAGLWGIRIQQGEQKIVSIVPILSVAPLPPTSPLLPPSPKLGISLLDRCMGIPLVFTWTLGIQML